MRATGEEIRSPSIGHRPSWVRSLAASVRPYGLAVLFLVVLAPLTGFSVYRSTLWIGTSFPGFLLMDNRVVPTVSGYQWPMDKADVFHAQVIAVDGAPVSSAAAVYESVASQPAGTRFTYTFQKAGRVFDRSIASRQFQLIDYLEVYGLIVLIGLMNLVLGFTVAFLQPGNREARTYVAMSFFGCLFTTTPVFLHQPGSPLLTVVYLVAESFFPAAFLHFAMCFPVDRLENARRPRLWVGLVYAISAILVAVKLAGFYAEPPDLAGLYGSYLYIAVSFVAFFVFMATAWWGQTDLTTRLRIRPLFPTVSIGCALAGFVFFNNTLGGGNLPMQLGLLVVPFFYGGIAYAIAAHDLFGIDRFVRWTFVYSLLSVLVYGAYTLLVGVAPTVAGATGSVHRVVLGLGFVSLALLIEPLRRLAQRVVDRAYFRTPWSYQRTISRLSREMTTWRRTERILDELTLLLTREMQIEATAVCLANGTALRRSADAALGPLAGVPRLDAAAEIVGDRGDALLAAAFLEQLPSELRPEWAEFFRAIQATIVLPLVFGHRLTGIVTLGPTRSRRPLHSEDLDLLQTLADQAAIAIENALSYEALEEHNRTLNETVKQRTAQLIQSEQLASLGQLVAGVAHELNNPVGAVYSSVDNLRTNLEAVEELLAAYEKAADVGDPDTQQRIEALRAQLGAGGGLTEARELLDICSEGSERIRNIVRALLSFARSDRGERLHADVAEGLESTLRLLAEQIAEAQIEVVREYGTVPPLEANIAQLNQVWMNVLTNAIDAVRGTRAAVIHVSLRAREETTAGATRRWVEVEVRDNGAGMPPNVQARIFEPFFTTKEIGRGTGLGMSIAYGVVRDHGGSIQVESAVGRGSVVRVRLPLSRAATDAPARVAANTAMRGVE